MNEVPGWAKFSGITGIIVSILGIFLIIAGGFTTMSVDFVANNHEFIEETIENEIKNLESNDELTKQEKKQLETFREEFYTNEAQVFDNIKELENLKMPGWYKAWYLFAAIAKLILNIAFIVACGGLLNLKRTAPKLFLWTTSTSLGVKIIGLLLGLLAGPVYAFTGIFSGLFIMLFDLLFLIIILAADKSAFYNSQHNSQITPEKRFGSRVY